MDVMISNIQKSMYNDIKKMEIKLMSAITDFASATQKNFDVIASNIKRLDDAITTFQNSPGVLSPEDQAALDKIQTQSTALAAAAVSDVKPVVPVVPVGA